MDGIAVTEAQSGETRSGSIDAADEGAISSKPEDLMTNPKHPVSQELAELIEPEAIKAAIRKTEYKYFGHYEFSDDQHEAVDLLVKVAQQYLTRPIPTAPQSRDGLVEALGKHTRFVAYSYMDPLAIRFEFASDDDRVAAVNAVDTVLRTASGEATEPSAPLSDEAVERVARIIDPTAFQLRDELIRTDPIEKAQGRRFPDRDMATEMAEKQCEKAFVKAREIAALSESIPSTAPEAGPITAKQVGDAMQEAWDDICADTNCHPLDIRREGRKLYFHPAHWAEYTAMFLNAALATTAQGEVVQASPVAYRYVHLDYAGRKVSRYGTHAERVNGHDPIEVHPLYDHRLAFSHPSGEVGKVVADLAADDWAHTGDDIVSINDRLKRHILAARAALSTPETVSLKGDRV